MIQNQRKKQDKISLQIDGPTCLMLSGHVLRMAVPRVPWATQRHSFRSTLLFVDPGYFIESENRQEPSFHSRDTKYEMFKCCTF